MAWIFVNQFFWPDAAATAQLLEDVAVEAARNRPVTVVCGPEGYAGGNEAGPAPAGVEIRRVRSAGFGHGTVRRLWSQATFAAYAALRMARARRGDTVVTMTSPPLLGVLGLLAQLGGARHVIWEMDLYPDVAVELGVFRRGGLAERLTGWFGDLSRRRANAVIVLGSCMAERLRRRSVGSVPIHVVENWADGGEIQPGPFRRDGLLKLFYSGNMGRAHEFETLAAAVRGLASSGRYTVSFHGGGPRRDAVAATIGRIPGVTFGGYRERAALADAFSEGDIGIVTQEPASLGTLVPSKVYGILAAGRPVLYVGPRDSTIGRLLAEEPAGWRVANGDAEGLIALLERLAAEPHEVEAAGRRAREVFVARFDRPGQVRKLISAIAGD